MVGPKEVCNLLIEKSEWKIDAATDLEVENPSQIDNGDKSERNPTGLDIRSRVIQHFLITLLGVGIEKRKKKDIKLDQITCAKTILSINAAIRATVKIHLEVA